MKTLQIVKFDLICIMVAMVTDTSLLNGHGFPKQNSLNLLVSQLLFYTLQQPGRLICTTM